MLLSEILTALRLEFCTLASTEFSLLSFENAKYSCITKVAESAFLREYKSSSSECCKLIECSSRTIDFLQFLVIMLLQFRVIEMF